VKVGGVEDRDGARPPQIGGIEASRGSSTGRRHGSGQKTPAIEAGPQRNRCILHGIFPEKSDTPRGSRRIGDLESIDASLRGDQRGLSTRPSRRAMPSQMLQNAGDFDVFRRWKKILFQTLDRIFRLP
jgi:hypothetical protein